MPIPTVRHAAAPPTILSADPTESIKSRRSSTPRPTCPTKGHIVLVNRATGEIRRGACERLVCSVCRPAAARRQSAAIAAAQPDLFVTLTRVGDDWPTIRRRVNRFRDLIRRELDGWQDCYSVEANPRGTGHHAHLFAFAAEPFTEVDHGLFGDAAVRAGLGPIVDVTMFRIDDGAKHLGYGLKSALNPPGEKSSAAEAFLVMNGGRLLHATRGFFRDGAGGGARTLAAAIKAIR